jgi:hypothetical protein
MSTGPDAELALLSALQSVGLDVRLPKTSDTSADLEITSPDGRQILIEVKYRALASPDGLPRQLERYDQELRRIESLTGRTVIGVLVADRVTEAARAILQSSGWGWFDLRGQLHVVAPGAFIHADTRPARDKPTGPREPFSGQAGLEVAVELLLDPATPIGVRPLAQRINRSPSTVSEVLARLRDANLLDSTQLPVVPDLFWSLASAWRSESVHINSLPSETDKPLLSALHVGLGDPVATGWALTDTRAAAIYGAPIGVRKDHPADFYVPDTRTLRRSAQMLGVASDNTSRTASLRKAPVSAVCSHRVTDVASRDGYWPLARPLFVALDLAQDAGRGREILEQWDPPQPWARVW